MRSETKKRCCITWRLGVLEQFFIPAVAIAVVPGLVISNLDSTGLRMEWSFTRTNTPDPDTGEVTVYNMAPSLIGTIYASWKSVRASGLQTGRSFTLSLGWNRIPQVALQGDIYDLSPNRRTPTDVLTTFRIGDGDKGRDAVVATDFHNVNIDTVLTWLVTLPPASVDTGGGGLGLVYPPDSRALVKGVAAATAFQNWGNLTKGLNVQEAITLVLETLGLEWRVHNGEFIVMRGGLIQRPGPTLSPGTGLVTYELTNDGGIRAFALADTRVEPGIRFQVTHASGTPVGELSYRCERVEFFGSTDEGSDMVVTGRKARPL